MSAQCAMSHAATKSQLRTCNTNHHSTAPQETTASFSRLKTQNRMNSLMNRVADHVRSDSSEYP